MNLQKTLVFFLTLAIIQLPQSAEAHSLLNQKNAFDKVLSYINQSRLMYFFEKQMAKLPKLLPYGHELASPEYQELGKEAQYAAGIPLEYHVPIKKIYSTHPFVSFVGAIAESDAIYVNEERLNQLPYGVRRSLLFHEAIHKKNNDMSSDSLLELLMVAGFSFASHVCIKAFKPAGKHKIMHGFAVALSALIGTAYVGSKYRYYLEHRADIEGHYATQCSKCVQESAARRRVSFEQENNPLKNNGYLWAHDLEIIAQELENEHKICTFHARGLIENLYVEIENT